MLGQGFASPLRALAPTPWEPPRNGEPGILIRQTAFVETDRWLTFGDGSDDVRRMRATQ